jgi:hypothetical protein
MAGAVVTTLAVGGGTAAVMPLALGLLAVFVVYGSTRRRNLAGDGSRTTMLQPVS